MKKSVNNNKKKYKEGSPTPYKLNNIGSYHKQKRLHNNLTKLKDKIFFFFSSS